MKNSKLFQYVFIGAFVFFIIVGAILFATYRSNREGSMQINITMWGTLPADSFSAFMNRYFSDKDLKYTVNYSAKNLATFDRELVEALASGVGPDAIILPQDLIVRYQDRIYPVPYTVFSELNFKQTYIQQGELFLNKNGVLALPFNIDPLVMYWNQDIFNNVSVTKPPTTWAEIADLVPKITKKDQAGNILTSTVALGEFRNITNAKSILSALLIQAGNPIVISDAEGNFESTLDNHFGLNTSPAVLSLQFYSSFANSARREYSWNRSLPNSFDAFASGDLAIYFGFASEYLKIKNKNPNLNFSVALLPQIKDAKVYSTFGQMQGLAIMKNSKNPAGAFTVLTALTSAEAVPFWKDLFNLPSARRDILGQIEQNAIKTIFNKSAIMSKGWLDPNAEQTSIIFQNMVESYTTGREVLESVINSASDRLDNLFK